MSDLLQVAPDLEQSIRETIKRLVEVKGCQPPFVLVGNAPLDGYVLHTAHGKVRFCRNDQFRLTDDMLFVMSRKDYRRARKGHVDVDFHMYAGLAVIP